MTKARATATAKAAPRPRKAGLRPVVVWTEHRIVVFGYAGDTRSDVIHLDRARMALDWGTTRGIYELAATGPTARSKISVRADIDVRKVICVMEATPAAAAAWEAVP